MEAAGTNLGNYVKMSSCLIDFMGFANLPGRYYNGHPGRREVSHPSVVVVRLWWGFSWDFLTPPNVSIWETYGFFNFKTTPFFGETGSDCSRIAPIDSCTSHAGTSPAVWEKTRIKTHGCLLHTYQDE